MAAEPVSAGRVSGSAERLSLALMVIWWVPVPESRWVFPSLSVDETVMVHLTLAYIKEQGIRLQVSGFR